MGCLGDALSVQQEAASLLCALSAHGQGKHKKELAGALKDYGRVLVRGGVFWRCTPYASLL